MQKDNQISPIASLVNDDGKNKVQYQIDYNYFVVLKFLKYVHKHYLLLFFQ